VDQNTSNKKFAGDEGDVHSYKKITVETGTIACKIRIVRPGEQGGTTETSRVRNREDCCVRGECVLRNRGNISANRWTLRERPGKIQLFGVMKGGGAGRAESTRRKGLGRDSVRIEWWKVYITAKSLTNREVGRIAEGEETLRGSPGVRKTRDTLLKPK